MTRVLSVLMAVCLALRCLSSSAVEQGATGEKDGGLPDAPKQSDPTEPVRRLLTSYETDDFELYCTCLSSRATSRIKELMGLRAAFEDGRGKQIGPVDELSFMASDHHSELKKLKPGYAFVEYTNGRRTGGTVVELENGVWKISGASLREAFEQYP